MPEPVDTTSPARSGPPPSRRGWVLGAAGVGAAALAGWSGLHLLGRRGPAALPELDYPIIDGRRIGPADLRGRVVLVNFWATSCTVCVAEMPELAALHAAYAPRGFELIAVAMPYDRADRVLHFAASRQLPFPVALDPMGRAVAAWGGVEGTPLTYLAGPDGRIAGRWLGRPDFGRVRAGIERLLPGRQG